MFIQTLGKGDDIPQIIFQRFFMVIKKSKYHKRLTFEIELYFVPLCIFFGIFVFGGILILPGVRGRERYYVGFKFVQNSFRELAITTQ